MKKEPQPPTELRWRVATVAWTVIAFALLVWAHVSFTPVLFFPLIALFAIVGVFTRYPWWHRDPDKLRGRKRYWVGVALRVLVIVGMLHGRHWMFARLEAAATPLVDALGRYHDDHGLYPDWEAKGTESVQALLVPNYLPTWPECPGADMHSFYYLSQDDEFTVGCVPFGFLKYDYSSATRKWRGWD